MVTPLMPAHMRDVTVTRQGKQVLGPVDLTLDRSGFTILLGPNGAGKTTFLKALHGLERLSTGSVTCPPLTTIAQDYGAIANRAASTLFGIIESETRLTEREETLFEGTLVMRASA
jgi:ABC-type cobalamin/Fe3+-siderophores transport system ATPase subunit